MELRRYLQIVWKWRWLIVLCAALAAAFSYGVSSIIPPVYRASTTLLVRSTTASGDDYGTAILNQHLAATYAELLTKRPIIEAAGLSAGLSPTAVPIETTAGKASRSRPRPVRAGGLSRRRKGAAVKGHAQTPLWS